MLQQLNNALGTQYAITEIKNGYLLQITTGDAYPYRIKYNKAGELVLEEQWEETPAKWYLIKKGNLETLISRLIARHNKACEYMENWKKL